MSRNEIQLAYPADMNAHTTAIALSCLSVVAALRAQSEPRPARPNVVFVLADDLGYRELGCFGQQQIKTPNLDRLAQQGMRLSRHYSGSPVCAPSRCVLMTGKHPVHVAVRDNKDAIAHRADANS